MSNVRYNAGTMTIEVDGLDDVSAVLGEIGDLSFSIIKRQTGIKDYGHIFPGHGGVLDRFDSVIFVAPFAEFLFRIVF